MEFTEFMTQRSKLLPSLPKKKKESYSKIRLSMRGKFKLVFLPIWNENGAKWKRKNRLSSSLWSLRGAFFYIYFVSLPHIVHAAKEKESVRVSFSDPATDLSAEARKKPFTAQWISQTCFLPARLRNLYVITSNRWEFMIPTFPGIYKITTEVEKMGQKLPVSHLKIHDEISFYSSSKKLMKIFNYIDD